MQGTREEMEDDLVIRSDGLDGFSFAAVFDGHGGVSSAKFLRYDNQMQITTNIDLYFSFSIVILLANN